MQQHHAYGLILGSTLPFPLLELPAASGEVQVLVRTGTVPRLGRRTNETHWFCTSEREALFDHPELGRIAVNDGREIIVQPASDADLDQLRLQILGAAMAVLLQQRGLVVLHASTVAVRGSAIVMLARSGSGKSTLAAHLVDRGHTLVSDDVTPIDARSKPPLVSPSYPYVRLWPDSAALLGRDPERLPQVWSDREKRNLRVERFAPEPLPLARILLLEPGDRVGIEPVPAREALLALLRHSFTAPVLRGSSTRAHFERCGRIVSAVPVSRLVRTLDPEGLEAAARLVES